MPPLLRRKPLAYCALRLFKRLVIGVKGERVWLKRHRLQDLDFTTKLVSLNSLNKILALEAKEGLVSLLVHPIRVKL